MGHSVSGFVARFDTLAAAARALPGARVARLEQGFGFLPLTDELAPGDATASDMQSLVGLTAVLAAWAAEQSRTFRIAYVETEYFGGLGSQAAVLWQDGKIALGPVRSNNESEDRPSAEWPINAVGRRLGVQRGEAFDEFDTLGLGRHRHNEGWAAAGQSVT
jgi:hypothetical protein